MTDSTPDRDPVEPGPPTDGNDDTHRIPLRPVLGAALFLGASIAFANAAAPLLDIIGLVLFAGLVAWLNAPLQAVLTRWVGRAVAIVVIVGGEMVALGVAGALVLGDLDDLFRSTSGSVHRALAARSGSGLGPRLERALNLGDGVQHWLSTLPQRLFFNGSAPPAAGQRFADLLVAAVLTAFFMAGGASIIATVVGLWRREEREPVWDLLRDVDRRAGLFLRRAVLLGIAVGVLVTALGAAIGLPYPALLGAWAGFWVPVPRLGWWVATIPVIAAAIQLDPLPLVAALVGSALVVALGHVASRRWRGNEVRPGVGLVMTAAAVGVASSGAGAAVLFAVVGVFVAAVWTSPHRGVGLPTPPVTDAEVYHVGPLEIPKGLHGIVWGATVVAVMTLAWFALVRGAAAIVWISIAILVAIAIDRPIDFMTNRFRLPRAACLGVVFVVGIAITGALVVSVVAQGPPAVGRALERVPSVVKQAEGLPFVGDSIRSGHLTRTVREELARLPNRVVASDTGRRWIPALGNQLISLMWVALLIAAYLIDGRRIVRSVARRIPAPRRRQTDRLAQVSYTALSGFARGSLLVALCCGVVVLILGLAAGVELVVFCALWAFLWDLVPQVGGIIGGIPLLLFAIAVSPTAFLVVLAIYVVYQLIESNLIFPAVIGDSVELPGWVALVAVLAGAAAAGVVGAIVLTPVVAAIRLIVIEYRKEDFPGRVVQS